MGRFGLKHHDLTPVLGVTRTQVSQRLRGHKPFTLRDIELVADFFGTTPAFFLGYANEPRPSRPRLIDLYTSRDSNPEPAD